MKWIDFDQLEELGNEDDPNQNEEASLDVHFLDDLLDKKEDIDDEEYLALPKDSVSGTSSQSYDEEEYFSLPREESEPVLDHRKHRRKREDVLFNMEKEQKNIYEISEEEAQRITMEEKRSQIGRMLGLRTMQGNLEEKEAQKKVSAEAEEPKLHIPEDYFEEMADRMAEEMLEQKGESGQDFRKELEQEVQPEPRAELEAEKKPEAEPEPELKPDPELERTLEAVLKHKLGPEAEPKRELEPESAEFEEEPELEIEPESGTGLETDQEESAQSEQKKEYDPMEFGGADEEFEKFRERYRRRLLFKENEQAEEPFADGPKDSSLENVIGDEIETDIKNENEIDIQNQMAGEEEQKPEDREEDINDGTEEVIEETEENAEDTDDAEESAFVDEEVFRRIELAEKRKRLGEEEQPEEESEKESEKWTEEESEEEGQPEEERQPEEEGQPEEERQPEEEQPEEEGEPEKESGKHMEKELSEGEQPKEKLEEGGQSEEKQEEFEGEYEEQVKKKPALQAEASKAKTRPETLYIKKSSGENQNTNTTIGVLQKRTLPKRQLGLDKAYAQKNFQDTIEQRKNGKVVKTAEQLEKKLQLSEVKRKEGSKKIDKLHSTFEEEFQDAAVDDLLVRRNKDTKKKAKKRKKHKVAWEEDDTPDHPFREFLTLILAIAIVVFVTFILVEFVGQRTEVIGSSMERTLQDGDNLIVDKITYVFKEPERFDIIVFPHVNARGEEVYFIKRIIGLPGEKVRIDNGFIYINGEKLQESYGKDNELILNAGRAVNNVLLGEDEYFVLGDNRNDSSDSREIGNVKRDQIVGRAWLRIWPINKFGIMKHQ